MDEASGIVGGVERCVHQRGLILTESGGEISNTSLVAIVLPHDRVVRREIHIVVALDGGTCDLDFESGKTVLLRCRVGGDVLHLDLEDVSTLSDSSVAEVGRGRSVLIDVELDAG